MPQLTRETMVAGSTGTQSPAMIFHWTGVRPNSRAARSPEFGKRHFTERNWQILERLEAMAKEKGVAPHHLAIKWVATHPAVTEPILGASNAKQVEDNLKYLDVNLSEEERKRLSED